MSDAPQGEGWWQASDGKWYPPEQAPGGPPAPGGAGGMGAAGGAGEASATGAFSYGWNKFTANPGPLVIAALIGFGVYLILFLISYFGLLSAFVFGAGDTECEFNSAGEFVCDGGGGVGFVASLFGFALFFGVIMFGFFIMQYLLARAGLVVVDGQQVEVSTILKFDYLGQYVLASLVMGVATFIGFMLCIIPGIIVYVLGVFFPFFVIDKGLGAIDSIKASFELVRANVGQVIILVLLAYVANFIGQLLCGVGLLVSMPVVAIATAYLYKRLQNEPVAA